MLQDRFQKLASLLKSVSVFAVLLMSACATQQTKDVTIDEQIETMKQIEELKQSSAAVVVEQDLGLLSLHERNEREALKNLETEMKEEQDRIPANQEAPEAAAEVKTEEAAKSESAEAVATNEKEESAPEEASSWSTAKIEALPQEELSQELFNADSIIVQKGDSLSGLAQKHLGNKKAWARIWSLNPNVQNPNVIEIGTKLYVPKVDSASRGLASALEPVLNAEAPKEELKTKEAEKTAKVADLAPTTQVAAEKVAAQAISAEPTKEVKENKEKATPAKEVAAPVAKVEAPAAKAEAPAKAQTGSYVENAIVSKGGSSHTLDELLVEHLETQRVLQFKGKALPEKKFSPRKIASVNDNAPDEAVKSIAASPSAFSRIISFAGILLLAAVVAGFAFAKPKNQ